MPIISDNLGTREISEEELQRLDEEAELNWAAFWAGLIWQPITLYDHQAGAVVLLSGDEGWEIGYWGVDHMNQDDRPMWRSAGDPKMGEPLEFEPEEFAIVSDEWRAHLIAG